MLNEISEPIKVTAATILAAGVVIVPMAFIISDVAGRLEENMQYLDNHPTEVFASVADCAASGFSADACKESWDIANSFELSDITHPSYSDPAECAQKHGDTCKKVSTVTSAGKTSIYGQTYDPPVVAWQAAQDDLTKSVPLYPSTKPGMAVRYDGKLFNLG
jgi:uncharacterized protein YgiB involved in biofilm formation